MKNIQMLMKVNNYWIVITGSNFQLISMKQFDKHVSGHLWRCLGKSHYDPQAFYTQKTRCKYFVIKESMRDQTQSVNLQ